MNQGPDANDETSAAPAIPEADRAPVAEYTPTPVAQRSSGAGLALLVAVLALALAGYSAWRLHLLERGEDNAQTALQQQLDAVEVRVTEAERRSARSNELASTLREQLSEIERLHARLREDLLTQGERSGRMEALLARLSNERGNASELLALDEAGLLLGQAQARLELFGDRVGSLTALDLAAQALAQAGPAQADVRAALIDARAVLAADGRPGTSTLLAELDAIAVTIEQAPLRVDRGGATSATHDTTWWGRQFERFDHLVTIRRSDEPDAIAAPTKDSADRALDRARLAVLEHQYALLPDALVHVRRSLLSCCDGPDVAATAARLQELADLDWNRPNPDLGALRDRFDQRLQIDRIPAPKPVPMPEPADRATEQAPSANEEEYGS